MKIPIKTKISITSKAKMYVFSNPAYWLTFFASTLLIMGFIIWSLNYELIGYILLDAPLTFWGKLEFFLDGYRSLFISFDSIQSFGILLFSVAFGINTSMLIFALKRSKQQPQKKGKAAGASSSLALGSAVIGGGCIACGTSLITPLLTTLGLTSVGLVRNIGSFFLYAGSLLTIYSIYKLSIVIVGIKARDQ